ncbi:MAG: 50S ribosomal protein L25/general stress protein Ctc [Magnetococcales bacterium]|nr:50S ribosomal protein L25/general stress protein Ctc [Magnetococcales bacterium]
MATIQAQSRAGLGTGNARQLRRAARLPAILYGGNDANSTLSLDLKEWLKLLDTEGSALRTHHQELLIDGNQKVAVLMRDYQIHPVTGLPLHVDFMRFDPSQVIHVSVPVHVVDEAKSPGIKMGGILEIICKDLDVHGRADRIPDAIEISVASLGIGDSIHIQDIQLPDGVEVSAEENFTILTMVGVHGEAAEGGVEG